MVRTQIILTAKIRSSTLMEVLISMVMILVVFGIAMAIYSNVLRLSLSIKKLRAQATLQDVMLIAEQTGDFNAQYFEKEDFRIKLESAVVPETKGLLTIHLTAYDQNEQKIAELQKMTLSK